MRKIGKWKMAAAVAAVLLTSTAANAAGAYVTCDQLATTAADLATKDIMQPAGEFEGTASGKVLVIAGGSKFYMPARQVDDRTLAVKSVWQRMRDWNYAYADAFWRCRHADTLTLQVQK